MFRKVCSIDLGSDTIKMTDKKKKRIICEKNMLAVRDADRVIALGQKAYAIYEKAPANVRAGSPMQNGAIADERNLCFLLSRLLHRFSRLKIRRPNVCITLPMDLSEIETRAFYHVLNSLWAQKVLLVEKGIADAVGIGLPVLSQNGGMVVNIGASTTEISVVSEGKVILGRQYRLGGGRMDEAVITMVRREHNLSIGHRTAETLRIEMGYLLNGEHQMRKVFGIHTVSGLPRHAVIPSEDVSAAIEDTVHEIGEAMLAMIQRTPPQILESIRRTGIYLTGGISLTPNIAYYIQDMVAIPVYNIPDPIYNTMNGMAEMMGDKTLRKLTISLREYAGNLKQNI